jgi:hypothetical protein
LGSETGSYHSRGVVRLVSYLIRKTLGWCDADGNPQEQHIRASYQELITRAGISREMIRGAIDEAIAGNFIVCSRKPEAKKSGGAGVSGLYELKWDERPEYVKDPEKFKGFFSADGNRTYIPNQFFVSCAPPSTGRRGLSAATTGRPATSSVESSSSPGT